jgi:hypothetical protein
MEFRLNLSRLVMMGLGLTFIASACAPAEAANPPASLTIIVPPTVTSLDWFAVELTDVQTGETFTINEYAGKVILLETMAIWCPNCAVQGSQVRKLHEALGYPDDLISISLDVDLNEDSASLNEYAQEYGFDWHFAIARSR